MTPEEQFASSVRYVCTQVCVVPHDSSRFSLFVAYGPHQTLQGQFTAEELIEWLKADFTKRLSLHKATQRMQAAQMAAAQEAVEAVSTLDIKIDI